jgi:hypothetical protein
MISTSPPSSGTTATGSRNLWEVSSDAPQNAATEPPAASAIALPSHGAVRSAGGASWNVSSDNSSASTAMPAMIQNSGRQAWNDACAPPISGPAATAPKMHMSKMIVVQRSLDAG